MSASVAWVRFWMCCAFFVSSSACVRMCWGIGCPNVSAHFIISCICVVGVSQWFWCWFQRIPGIDFSVVTCRLS